MALGAEGDQQRPHSQQEQMRDEVEVDGRREAALSASSDVPRRVRNRKPHSLPKSDSLKSFTELPDYLQDNEFIHSYYRPNLGVKNTLLSLFNLHNETGNIWTHLIGFALFVGLTVYIAVAPPTPLAIGKAQVDLLWHSVKDRVQSVHHSLPDLHSLQGNLQANLHSLSERMQGNLHSLSERVQDSLAERVHHLQGSLNERVLNLQGGLNVLAGALNKRMPQSLTSLLHWPTPRWPIYTFLAGAMGCLLCSSVCHLFACCSQHVSETIWRFDYAGIALLIVTSFFPPVYYGFLCEPFWMVFYLVTTTILGESST